MTPTRPVLALELSSDGISLHEQAYDGHWRRLAFAALNDPLLGRKMKDMRQKARDSKGRTFRCQVWIPAEQISLQEIQLEGDDPTGFPEQVRAILGPNTGEIDIGVTDSKGRAWVAHVPSEVLAQARKFARDYGFPATAVSTSAPLKGFSRPPFFDHVANATVM
ncbi:MAG TPA: hypothetical protein VLA51_01865, partial [Paracoccaceae bacterium]|nr:hypothetical protein [Paracoccaceae bacterium]